MRPSSSEGSIAASDCGAESRQSFRRYRHVLVPQVPSGHRISQGARLALDWDAVWRTLLKTAVELAAWAASSGDP
jgi:hypothetical protein